MCQICSKGNIIILQVQLAACTSLSVKNVNQAFEASFVGIEMLEDGKIMICPQAAAYGKSDHCQSAASIQTLGFHEPS